MCDEWRVICCSDGHAMTMKGTDEGGEVGCDCAQVAGIYEIMDYVSICARAQKSM